MENGTFVEPRYYETSDDCLECTRCKIDDVYVDDEASGWLYYFTADGCQKNCSRFGFPYE